MKLVALALLLSFAALRLAWGTEANAAVVQAGDVSPPRVYQADVVAAAQRFPAVSFESGMAGWGAESVECRRQFSAQPSWRLLDRCIAIDYIGNALFGPREHFHATAINQRWQDGVSRLGGDPDLLDERIQQIARIIPWDSLAPQK